MVGGNKMNDCLKRVDPNEYHDVQKYFDILDEHLRLIKEANDKLKQAFIEKGITKLPGSVINEMSYPFRQEDGVNQMRKIEDRIRITINYIRTQEEFLMNIKSGKYQPYPYKAED
jgi:hypothetical protein